MAKKIKRPHFLLIGIALVLIPILLNNHQTTQATYSSSLVNFRTDDLTYNYPSSIAYSSSCGNQLSGYQYYGYNTISQSCDGYSPRWTFLINVPPDRKLYISSAITQTGWLFICKDNDRWSAYKPSSSVSVSLSPTVIDQSKEKLCSGGGTVTSTTTLPSSGGGGTGTATTTLPSGGGNGGGTSCVPQTEICDGIDNNCNGLIDEGNVCGNGGGTGGGTSFFDQVLFTIAGFQVTGLYFIIGGGLLILLALI